MKIAKTMMYGFFIGFYLGWFALIMIQIYFYDYVYTLNCFFADLLFRIIITIIVLYIYFWQKRKEERLLPQ